ncbi:hypothetical protein ACFLT9_05130 [Acidobacteriota bacterium]
MKSKKFMVLVVAILILFTLTSYAETKKLKEIGRFTLVRIKGEVPTSEVMKILVEKYAGDIKYGFDKAGYGNLFIPFLEQIKTANFAEKQLPIGTHFMWMLFRSQGKVKLVEDLEWAGTAPLPVFSFIVKKDFKNYEIIMPRPCGNISLLGIEEAIPDPICDIRVSPAKANIGDPVTIDMSGSKYAKTMEVEVFNADGVKLASKTLTAESPRWQTKFDTGGEYIFRAKVIGVEGKISGNPCEVRTYINIPPLCKLWTACLPCVDYVGRPITIDANNSSDPDGSVAKVDFEITDLAGNVIDTFTDTASPFIWEKVFYKEGTYNISAVVTDDFGALSDPCTALAIEVTQKKLFFKIDGGILFARGSHGLYFLPRVGLAFRIVPDVLTLLVDAGPGIALSGEPWKTFFMGDILLNFHAGSVFFGGGIGYATKVKDERTGDFLLIGDIGVELFKTWKYIGSLFFEFHGPLGEGKSFAKHHKLVLGFRYIF